MFYKISLTILATLSILFSGCANTMVEHSSEASNTLATLDTLYQYQVINSKSKQPLSAFSLASELKNTNVIFMGEFHSHQGAHKLQLDLLQALYQQNPSIILSMEQFSRDAQPIVDGYLAGEYGENTLIEEGDALDHYKGSYRAIVEFARDKKIPIIASNAPTMFVRCVGKKGIEVLETIPDEKKPWSARKLDLANEHYQAKFMSFLQETGTRHGQTKEVASKRMMNTYAAQLLRDTTMAESIDMAIIENPGYQVIHLNGAFHSDDHLGTVAVFETMNPELTTSVMSPVMVEDANNPVASDRQYEQGDYVYLLRAMPIRYIDKEKEKVAIYKLIKERMGKKCEL